MAERPLMRSRRTSDVFVIGEERILDEAELGLEAPEEPFQQAPARDGEAAAGERLAAEEAEPFADDDEPIRVVQRSPRRAFSQPVAFGRWAARGVAIASVLIVAVLVGSALLPSGERDSRGPVVAQRPAPAQPKAVPDRQPAAQPRDRARDPDPTRPPEAKPEPPRPESKPSPEPELEAPPSEPSPMAPGPVQAAPTASAPVAAPAPPTAATSSTSGGPAVASAAEVRQEFGP